MCPECGRHRWDLRLQSFLFPFFVPLFLFSFLCTEAGQARSGHGAEKWPQKMPCLIRQDKNTAARNPFGAFPYERFCRSLCTLVQRDSKPAGFNSHWTKSSFLEDYTQSRSIFQELFSVLDIWPICQNPLHHFCRRCTKSTCPKKLLHIKRPPENRGPGVINRF